MKINFRHFPHPVLTSFGEDYVEGKFTVNLDVNISSNRYTLEGEIEVECSDIENLISSGKAEYGIHVECPLTCFRLFEKSSDTLIDFSIQNDKLDGNVEVSTFIYATQEINHYSSKLFNDIFEDYSFTLEPGDIIAVGRQFDFEAEKNLDPIGKTPSIFSVQPNEREENPPTLDVETNSEKIIIYLDEDSFENYNYLKENQFLPHVFASFLAVPVLTEIFQDIKDNEESAKTNYRSRRWYRVLTERLKELGMDLEEGYEIDKPASLAQKVIDQPLKKSLKDLKRLQDEGVI